MDSALIRRALEIVDEAMSYDVADRASFVREACRGDGPLQTEVGRFLEFDSGISIAQPTDSQEPIDLPDIVASPNRYELHNEIGRGGMGVIYNAFDRVLEREVAIKVLLDQHKDRGDLLRRFIFEARIGGQLQHPGIAPVYDMGRFGDDRLFFAMKLVRGETLAELLSNRGENQSDESRLLSIFEQLCQTVSFAHSHNIIHRDLKPANVMVGQFGEVQLMDWGLAKVLSEDNAEGGEPLEDQTIAESESDADGHSPTISESPVNTRLGLAMGTPAYMPPEQSFGRRDKTTDVFALGAILCEILTGNPPYTASSPTKIHEASTLGDTSEAITRLNDCGSDEDLITLAKKCLAVSPDDRYQDASEVARLISDYKDATQSRLRAAEIAAARADAVSREERKRRRLTVALATTALAVVVILTGGWTWYSQQQANRERELNEQQARRRIEIDTALAKARDLYERAGTASVTELDPWIEARAAVARAESLVQTESVDEEFAAKVQGLRAEIDAGESARKLVIAIESAREAVFTNPDPVDLSVDIILDSLETAFRQHDLHPDSEDVDAAVARIADFSPNVRDEVVGALDQWLLNARESQREWLLGVLSESDNDPRRLKWREAYIRDDREALTSMLRDPVLRLDAPRSILNVHQSVQDSVAIEDQAKILKSIQPLHSDDFWLNVRLAELVWKRDRSFDALAYYAAAAAIRPSGPMHNRIGDILWALDRRAEAKRHYTRAELLYKQVDPRWSDLSALIAGSNNLEDKISAAKEVLGRYPESLDAHAKLSGLLNSAGRNDEAIQVMRRAVELQPRDFWCCMHLTVVVVDSGDLTEIVRSFEPWLSHVDNKLYISQIRAWSQQAVLTAISVVGQHTGKSGQAAEEEVAYFSNQARRWMDVYLQARMPPKLQRLLDDPRFAAVREPEQLAKLPREHRRRWESFWSGIRSQNELVKAKAAEQAKFFEALSWYPLVPESMQSTGGADLSLIEDGSIRATGTIKKRDVYVIEAIAPSDRLAAIRLEVLSDPELPNNGPGRHETGNFHLGDIRIEVFENQSVEPKDLAIGSAWASYAWKDRPIEFSIDDDPLTAWHVWGQLGKSHWAVFTLDEPFVGEENLRISIELRHAGEPGAMLGRFRLSVTPEVARESNRDGNSSEEGGSPAGENVRQNLFETLTWHVLEPENMESKAGAELTLESDASILVTGINEANDDYVIESKVHGMNLEAIRLDVIADPALPNNGPGRHETGNFQLAEVKVEMIDEEASSASRLEIDSAWASYCWRDRPIERAIDDDLSTAWHIWGELSKSHWAVFTLAEPVKRTEPWKLRITLRHGGDLGPGLGRFRLSVASADR